LEIKVRKSIRVLGLLLTALGYWSIILLIFSKDSLDRSDFVFIITNAVFFLPLVFLSSILGRVPYFISKYIPEHMEEELTKAENFFTEFSSKSILFAISFVIVAIFTAYYWG
tara:strand:+ start:615 stop:950 length:336 start_codon:yes stop_codon:yes gene_type:complete